MPIHKKIVGELLFSNFIKPIKPKQQRPVMIRASDHGNSMLKSSSFIE